MAGKKRKKYEVTRRRIVNAALSLRGTRFRHQGRSAETGVDCVGFLYVVLKKLRYPAIVDVEGYRKTPPASIIRETLLQNFDEIPLADVGLGDIFLMRIGGRKPKHASILVSNVTDLEKGMEPQIIHAYGMGDKGSVVVEPLRQWRNKCVTAFRLRGLKD